MLAIRFDMRRELDTDAVALGCGQGWIDGNRDDGIRSEVHLNACCGVTINYRTANITWRCIFSPR